MRMGPKYRRGQQRKLVAIDKHGADIFVTNAAKQKARGVKHRHSGHQLQHE